MTNTEIGNLLDSSKTSYHAVENAKTLLDENGFKELSECSRWELQLGGKYYVVRDGSALAAFRLPKKMKELSFIIAASHTDSPCLKLKLNPENSCLNYTRLSVEKYGGGLYYSFFDTPLCVAGRVACLTDAGVESINICLDRTFVIPSVAIHYNRAANDGIKINPQQDLQLLGGLGEQLNGITSAISHKIQGEVIDYDLYAVPATKPFTAGFNGELTCSPRVDNLTSVFAGVNAIIDCTPSAVAVALLADSEEIGSRTLTGAGSTLLKDVLMRINSCLGGDSEDYAVAIGKSFMASCDNAHAVHPNHPELSDPTNKTLLGKGIVIKHHANKNYTTDALAAAAVKRVFANANVGYQEFHMRSDLPCGGTLGAISNAQVSLRCVDIGIAQLAMHSAVETFCTEDYYTMINGIKALFGSGLRCDGNKIIL